MRRVRRFRGGSKPHCRSASSLSSPRVQPFAVEVCPVACRCDGSRGRPIPIWNTTCAERAASSLRRRKSTACRIGHSGRAASRASLAEHHVRIDAEFLLSVIFTFEVVARVFGGQTQVRRVRVVVQVRNSSSSSAPQAISEVARVKCSPSQARQAACRRDPVLQSPRPFTTSMPA